jgi:hypothetical protein
VIERTEEDKENSGFWWKGRRNLNCLEAGGEKFEKRKEMRRVFITVMG